jgi:hypothetical protein
MMGARPGRAVGAVIAATALAACASAPPPEVSLSPQDEFFSRLAALCGQAFAGHVATTDPVDADMARHQLVMHVRECSEDEVRISFHVGEDRSRTWVITRTQSGLRLKHDHRHEDGTEDAMTQYGGDTVSSGTAERQEFPADAFSQALFVENGIPQSVSNVWAIEVRPYDAFAYELRRPNRHFRVEFDLRLPVTPPPPPWGSE